MPRFKILSACELVVLRLTFYDRLRTMSRAFDRGRQTCGSSPRDFSLPSVAGRMRPPDTPRPSMQHLETAKQLNLPVFAVTPNEVWVADPVAGITPVVRNLRWAANIDAMLRAQR